MRTCIPAIHRRIRGFVFAIVLCLLSGTISVAAYAQDACSNLSEDLNWNKGLLSVMELLRQENYEDAWTEARRLSNVCSRSPVLNYLTGLIADRREDKVAALYYYQKASEYTYVFAVDPETAQKIWYARYEAEHPSQSTQALQNMQSQSKDLRDEISRLQSDNAALRDANLQLAQQNLAQEALVHQIPVLQTEIEDHTTDMLWTGVGVGTTGLVLLGTGLGLILAYKTDSAEINYIDDAEQNAIQYRVRNPYIAGWYVFGAGTILTIGGAIITGIYGYRYALTENEEASVALRFAPGYAGLDLRF